MSTPAVAATDECDTNKVCTTYTYDVHGRLVAVREVEDDGGSETSEDVEYTYDDAGNRIKKDTDA